MFWFVALRFVRAFSWFALLLTLTLAHGCGSKSDAKVVDFTKTTPVARPGDQPSQSPSLRVAVAAMISPRETFFNYRQLLEYIGGHLSQDIELVQRKTYREINELLRKGEIDLAFICSGPYALGKEKNDFNLSDGLHSLEDLQEKVQESVCRVVILDLDNLPVDNRFFRELKRKNPRLHIVGLSSRPFHPELEEAMSSHISSCLTKPLDMEELLYWLRSVCQEEKNI
ncbi:MAG: PhnD/SsuA/transferrin family substrate-binding protein [Deltaproteobacteria bacterium]|nr:MAG: PhnD/SsuA/transferrin family substrate-binding protein [Deltaproteobacteria bacterium]